MERGAYTVVRARIELGRRPIDGLTNQLRRLSNSKIADRPSSIRVQRDRKSE